MAFNRSTATKSEAAHRRILLTLMVETTDLLMEALTLARLLSRFLIASLMALGLFNGPGSEELSLWEIITLASIIKYLEEMR